MGWKGVPVEALVWLAGSLRRGDFKTLPDPPREILVLRPNDFGDLLTATPIFEALRRRFPTSRLIAGVGSWGRPVLENNPFVDEIVELDVPWNNKVVKDQSWGAVFRFLFRSPQVAALRKRGGFDVGIDLLGSHIGAVLMMRLGVRYRVGIRGYRGGWSACRRYTHFSREVTVPSAALAQAAVLGATHLPEPRPQIYLRDTERAEATRLWTTATHAAAVRLLVGCGAGLEGKTWPTAAMAEALRMLSAGLTTETGPPAILIVGGPGDRERAAQVLGTGIPGAHSLCGEIPLRITFALAEQADVVLTNPSMLLHAAAAFRRPTVAVLGGMYWDAAKHDILWGYPPPYSSIGASTPGGWPAVEEVVAAVMARAQPQLTPATATAT